MLYAKPVPQGSSSTLKNILRETPEFDSGRGVLDQPAAETGNRSILKAEFKEMPALLPRKVIAELKFALKACVWNKSVLSEADSVIEVHAGNAAAGRVRHEDIGIVRKLKDKLVQNAGGGGKGVIHHEGLETIRAWGSRSWVFEPI